MMCVGLYLCFYVVGQVGFEQWLQQVVVEYFYILFFGGQVVIMFDLVFGDQDVVMGIGQVCGGVQFVYCGGVDLVGVVVFVGYQLVVLVVVYYEVVVWFMVVVSFVWYIFQVVLFVYGLVYDFGEILLVYFCQCVQFELGFFLLLFDQLQVGCCQELYNEGQQQGQNLGEYQMFDLNREE